MLLFGAGDFKNNSRATSPREVSLSMRTPILSFYHGGTRVRPVATSSAYCSTYVIFTPGVFHFVAKTQRQHAACQTKMNVLRTINCCESRMST